MAAKKKKKLTPTQELKLEIVGLGADQVSDRQTIKHLEIKNADLFESCEKFRDKHLKIAVISKDTINQLKTENADKKEALENLSVCEAANKTLSDEVIFLRAIIQGLLKGVNCE